MVLGERTALWVSPVSNLGGVARHLLDVAATGIPGWRLIFLAPPGPLVEALQARGAAVLADEIGPHTHLRTSLATLRRAVDHLRPDVVHTHLAYADLAAALAVHGRQVRLVSTEHGIAGGDLVYHGSPAASRAMALAHRIRLRRFDALIAVSEATAAAMAAKWGARGVQVVRNGVDPVAEAARTRGLRVLSLSRLAPEKRLDRLLAGFSALAGRHPEARLTLAGAGPEEAALRREIDRLGLSGRISLPGHVDAVGALAEADVVAQLSVWENGSYTLLDAAVRGLGVVASPVGANPEMLPAACLVDPDDTEAVADALEAQGLKTDVRPGLHGWPTVADSTARLAEVYDRIGGAR